MLLLAPKFGADTTMLMPGEQLRLALLRKPNGQATNLDPDMLSIKDSGSYPTLRNSWKGGQGDFHWLIV